MTTEEKKTLFAPAERDGRSEVQKQSRSVQAISLLRQLLDAVPDILLMLNDKRQIVFANQRLIEALEGGDLKEVYGARPGELWRCIHSDETKGGCGTSESCRHCGAVLAILSSQQGKTDVRECRIVRKEKGEALSLKVRATPFDIEGKQYTIFCVEDISDEKRRKVLERVLFQGILGGAQKMRQDAADARERGLEELELFRGQVFRCADAVIEEVNEHRILAAAESGELHSQPLAIGGLEVLKKVVEFYEKRPESQGREIRIQRQAREGFFITDSVLLKQVLGYMIANALEGCEEGDTVRLDVEESKKGVEFIVHNPGYMSQKVQTQVFQRGFSTKGEGRGVGTYALRLLTEKYLKGEVSFTSTERVGTVFRLSLPMQI